VGVYRYVSEPGLLGTQIEFSSEQPSAACGINQSSHTHTPSRRIGAGRDIDDRGVWCKLACNHAARFSNIDTHFTSAFQQNAIKFLAAHLIRLRLRDLPNAGEVNVSPALAVMRQEARAPLRWETCGLDLLGDAQSRERVVRSRQQRFTDMESREGLTLKENDRMAPLP
jgi:hypothetical protein